MKKITQNQHITLESLRGMSAVAVLLAHTFQFFLARYHTDLYRSVGIIAQSSVMVFFVMSGYLIGISAQNNIIKNGVFKLEQYAKSRFQRILPPLILSLVIVLILAFIAPYVFESGTQKVITTTDEFIKGRGVFYWHSQLFAVLTFTNGLLPQGAPFNTPLWSLPMEVWYYVLAALLITRKMLYVVIAIILIYSIFYANPQFLIFGSVWFAGFVLSFLDVKGKLHLAIAALLTIVSAFIAFKYGYEYLTRGGDNTFYNMWFGLAFAAATYLFILRLNIRINIFPQASKFSYTLYIIHYPILIFIIGVFEHRILSGFYHALPFALSTVLIAIAFAYKAAQYVENPEFIKKIM